ncbi:hypothetical protein ACHELY_004216, partial [Vibrio vulnificus]
REDDEKKDRKKKPTVRSEKEKVRKQRMRENTNSTVSHKNSEHPHHAPYRHSRAHGNPFIHARRMSRLEMHSPQTTT